MISDIRESNQFAMKNTLFYLCLISILFITSCSKGGSSSDVPALPKASITDVSDYRSVSNSIYHFTVGLNTTSSSPISIAYATAEGTAKNNTDFKAVSGTLTIPANSSTGTIDVEIVGDSTRKDNQYFTIQLSNPSNCTLGTSMATGTILNENGLYYPVDNAGYSTPATYPGMTLTWSDEFGGKSINNNNWTFEQGGGGWGNNELENYTDRTQNAFVSNGNLIIEARQENYNGNKYTSARMITKNKKTFTFGRIDIRAKMPKGKGVWPALWMLGNNIDAVSWPACGEMDILELLGQEPNKIYGTLHWGTSSTTHDSKGSNYVLNTGSFDQQFHVYSLVWAQDLVQIYVDDILYNTVTKNNVGPYYPFNSPFFFIFNVAVGGSWPGSPDGTTVFPQRMVVDYVRVFN